MADPTTLNFGLQPTSPAIDAGTNVGLLSDYAGSSVPRKLAARHRAIRMEIVAARGREAQYAKRQGVPETRGISPALGCRKTKWGR